MSGMLQVAKSMNPSDVNRTVLDLVKNEMIEMTARMFVLATLVLVGLRTSKRIAFTVEL